MANSTDIFRDPIKCPMCDFEYNHLSEVKQIPGKDNYEAPWPGRGDLLVITFWCEEGHTWELCFGQHKGQIYSFNKILKVK
jgi:hypothetical protein